MLRRILISLVVLLTLPAFAHAWYVNAKSSPATGQGTVSPAGTKYYANGVDSGEYAVAPAAGFKVSRVTIDGVAVPLEADNTYVVPYVFGKSYRYLVAYFAANTVNITLDAGPNGGIREDNNESLADIPAGSSRQLIIAPASGYAIDTYSAAGATSDVLNGDGTRTVTYENLQADQSVAATFALIPVVTANAGPDQTTDGTGAAKAVVLDGSATSNLGAITYAWSGPADLVFATPAAARTEVYSDLAGTYTATLTVTSGAVTVSDDVVVNVISNVQAIEDECLSCHGTRHPIQMAAYDASSHKSSTHAEVSCKACHDPAGSTHYTDKAPYGADTADQGCQSCHSGDYGIYNPDMTAKVPHGGGTVLAQAQYLSANATCADCHASHDNTINGEYGASAHGNVTGEAWWHYDWSAANRASCAPCHSTTGLINKLAKDLDPLAAATPVAQMEVLSCKGCHSDVATGAVRNDSTAMPATYKFEGGTENGAFPIVGNSNVCLSCHAGRVSGMNVKARTDLVAGTNVSFTNSHYLAAGGTLFKSIGYEYTAAERPYANMSSFAHDKLGTVAGDVEVKPGTGVGGPCVSCHLGNGSTRANHQFGIAGFMGGTCGTAGGVAGACHSTLTQVELDTEKEHFEESLFVLSALLKNQGFTWSPASPYFAAADWTKNGTVDGKHMLGAAFNLNYLLHEPGAYAHNRYYAKRLLIDSIDFVFDADLEPLTILVDGTRTYYQGSDAGTAIQAAVGLTYNDHAGVEQTFTQAQADNVLLYLDASSTLEGFQRR